MGTVWMTEPSVGRSTSKLAPSAAAPSCEVPSVPARLAVALSIHADSTRRESLTAPACFGAEAPQSNILLADEPVDGSREGGDVYVSGRSLAEGARRCDVQP